MQQIPPLMRFIYRNYIQTKKGGFFMKKIKGLVTVFLIGVLVLCPIYASAEVSDGITEIMYPEVYLDDVVADNMTRAMSSGTVTFNRDSSTKGSGYASINTTGIADYIKITITLQQAASGSSSYSNSSQDSVTKTVYDTSHIRKNFSFKVTSSKNYRVKVVVKDKINGVVSTRTLYKKLT